MINGEYCNLCEKRFDEDVNRKNNGIVHEECDKYSDILRKDGVKESEIKDVLKGNIVPTTPKYWDCECNENYIHPFEQSTCSECGAFRDDQPDSRIIEVLKKGLKL